MERSDDVMIGGQQQAQQNSANSFLNSTNGDINYGSLLNANNSASSNVSGGGGSGGNNNGANNNGMNGSAANTNGTANNSSANNPVYTMPGILHFLQHEWNRFEYERQQWEIDRSELMTKISFLQGERRGQESLKNNLIRRIKMLELALKQERIKYHKLKYGTEPAELKLPASSVSNGLNENDETEFSIGKHPILNKENSSSSTIKQGRQLLKQYLQEIGYTDAVIDIRSSRLRSLLGLGGGGGGVKSANGDLEQLLASGAQNIEASIASLINGIGNNNNKQQLLQLSSKKSQQNGNLSVNDVEKMLKLGTSDNVKHNYNTNNHKGNDQDEEMSEEDTNNNSSKLRNADNDEEGEQIDADTEDALNEFAFLSNEKSSSSSSSLSLDQSAGGGLDSTTVTSGADDWDVDRTQLNELTEQYKKERRSNKSANTTQQGVKSNQFSISTGNANTTAASGAAGSSQRPNRTALQAMMANLSENDAEATRNSELNLKISAGAVSSSSSTGGGTAFAHNVSSGGLFLEDDLDSSLGELSRISVNNNTLNLSGINDETIDSTQSKVLTAKISLRGHFDSVRCLAFHPTESALLTGSEDQTIKLWNLEKSPLNSKKSVNTDIEPAYTFRRHTGPVLSLIVSPNGDFCISSGLDSKVFVWNMPNFDTCDQYDQYNPSVFLKSLNGHTDAVWQMALVDNTLVTVSADTSIRIWNPFSIDELDETTTVSLSCLNEDKSEGTPTSVDFVNNENTKIVASFDRSHHCLYDIETSKIIAKFDYHDSKTNTHCYKVLSHPVSATPSSSLIMSAHEDKKIRFFDINSGKMTYQLVAHQDACTDLAIDPTCIYLLSASHDCSVRLWNLESKSCVQELTSHRKKYDESINCIAFHPTKPFVASGAADAIVKIYV